MVDDAAINEHLLRHLKQLIATPDVKVILGEPDDLKAPAERLFLVSERVATLIKQPASDRVLVYPVLQGVLNKDIAKLAKRMNSVLVKEQLFSH
ncbi:hypothetical protein [Lactiplantibacillus carotarum]|uniref:hypothetical protein n=1 Tax=Lactiplantibacillus carotarum TaxID=2993456 RepID=UPI00298F132B|nr:hypothetical protein [Lactiplantibacillus carotarum]